MKIYLLIIGKKPLLESFSFKKLLTMLSDYGHDISEIKFISSLEGIKVMFDLFESNSVVLTVGETNAARELFEGIATHKGSNFYTYQSVTYFPLDSIDEKLILGTLVPALNTKSNNLCNTVIFKTFELSEADIMDLIQPIIKQAPKGKMEFTISQSGMECILKIKYMQNCPSAICNQIIFDIGKALDKYIFAKKDVSLVSQAAALLLKSGRKLSIAESFTGGGVASSLISVPGMSRCLLESLVTYSHESKMYRLGVHKEILDKYGAVSAETAYEMALGLFRNPDADIVISTTGNAGPDVENGSVGMAFFAIGDKNNIHMYRSNLSVMNAENKTEAEIREEITDMVIKSALFGLIKYLDNN